MTITSPSNHKQLDRIKADNAKLSDPRQFKISAEAEQLIDTLTEADLDKVSAAVPKGYEELFGTYRLCLQYLADHWYMHRGHLADARRSAGVDRMWV